MCCTRARLDGWHLQQQRSPHTLFQTRHRFSLEAAQHSKDHRLHQPTAHRCCNARPPRAKQKPTERHMQLVSWLRALIRKFDREAPCRSKPRRFATPWQRVLRIAHTSCGLAPDLSACRTLAADPPQPTKDLETVTPLLTIRASGFRVLAFRRRGEGAPKNKCKSHQCQQATHQPTEQAPCLCQSQLQLHTWHKARVPEFCQYLRATLHARRPRLVLGASLPISKSGRRGQLNKEKKTAN